MGEISEMMADGILCEECGGFVGEEIIISNGGKIKGKAILETPGVPLKCEDCERPRRKASRRKAK